MSNPKSTFAYIKKANWVISSPLGGRAVIEVAGEESFRIVEITEASTRVEYRRRGLYKAISGFLIEKLIEESKDTVNPIGAIYGETNLAMPGVVFAAVENGRRFSYFDAPWLGINRPDFGILPQNFKVEDGVETRPYNDFALSYVPLS